MTIDFENASLLDGVLSRLSAEYWYDVDHNAGRLAHLMFVESGATYQIQDSVFVGRDNIKSFYSWREGRGPRVARHCFTNVLTHIQADGSATMSSILLLYADDGVPILRSCAPIQIADVQDECMMIDGRWMYKSRRLTTLFAGGVEITLPGN